MKALPAAVVASLFLSIGAPVAAKENKPTETNPTKGLDALKKGLDAMTAAAIPPGQSNRPVDPDQGDDNASDRAIQMVCTKDAGSPALRDLSETRFALGGLQIGRVPPAPQGGAGEAEP